MLGRDVLAPSPPAPVPDPAAGKAAGHMIRDLDPLDEAAAARIASLAPSGRLSRPIALAGFMGVGKTTLGRMLAELLGRPFFDTDTHVEQRTGRRIDDFFLADQEGDFRRLEAEAVAELVGRGAVVIALGGGALLDDHSRVLLRDRSLLVHLDLPWRELRARVPELVATRPLLRGKSLTEIHRLYLARLPTYRIAAARITIGNQSPAGTLSEVLVALQSLAGDARPGEAASHRHSISITPADQGA
jgi:shikimate kinase